MIDSFESMHERWGPTLTALEWAFTVIFTIEYVARLSCVERPLSLRAQRPRHHRSRRRPADLGGALLPRPARADRRAPAALAAPVPDPEARRVRRGVRRARPGADGEPAQDPRLPELRPARRRRHGNDPLRRRGPGERLHQRAGVGVLGDLDDDDGRLRRHHAEDRPRPLHRVADDADRLGHAGGADGHRQRRVHRPSLRRHRARSRSRLQRLRRRRTTGPRARFCQDCGAALPPR